MLPFYTHSKPNLPTFNAFENKQFLLLFGGEKISSEIVRPSFFMFSFNWQVNVKTSEMNAFLNFHVINTVENNKVRKSTFHENIASRMLPNT